MQQLELGFDPQPKIRNLFFMTSGLNTNELCYTIYTTYGNALGYSHKDAFLKLLKSGYSEKDAERLLRKARRTHSWIVYQYQQSFNF